MRVRRDEGLQLGWFPTGLRPGELSCVFVVKATYALRHDAPLALLPEGDLVSGDVPSEDGRGGLVYGSDFVPFKPRADVVLRATAHAPRGEPVRYLPLSMRVGGVQKQLLAIGDRVWRGGLLGRSPGEPAPFTTMPLQWERAFGGTGDARNPVGVGQSAGPMPNVEWPDRLLRSPGDRVEPAGLAPIGPQWEPRKSRVGTYRGDYMQTRWPWFPADLEWSHFNCAPADQQVEGYLRGDEAMQFTNLHRDHDELRARLPGVRARCFVTLQGGEFRPVELKLDTLFVDLEADKLTLVWRGFTPVSGLRLRELDGVFATLEPLGTEQPVEHYRRLRDAAPPEDVEAVAAAAAFEAKLAALEAVMADAAARAAALDARMDAASAAADAELAAQEQALLAMGVDPKLLAGPPMPQDLAAARAEVAAAVAQLRAERPDLAPLTDGGPDEDEPDDVQEAAGDAEPTPWTRERVVAALAAGDSLVAAVLRGLDLSELDFAGADLVGAELVGANLTGCRFVGANLERSLLNEANLERCDCSEANLDGADLTAAACAAVSFRGASLAAAKLEGLQLAGLDFTGCRGRAPSFAGSDLSGCNFAGAGLPKADFGGCQLSGACFVGADLQAARFGEAKAQRVDFAGADLRGMHGGDACDFTAASFRQARLDGAILTGAMLDGADFGYASMPRVLLTEASLQGAELSRADLARSVLDDANLKGARLLQTNLLYCAMERVELDGADLRWANLYGAGLWQARTATADLREANLAGTLLA